MICPQNFAHAKAAKDAKGSGGIGFGILDVLFLIEEEILTSRSCGTGLRAKEVLKLEA